MAIQVNINKAKEITKDRLRAERKPKLEVLDVEVLKNINNAEKVSEIESKKQQLRDAPAQVDSMTTVEQLKSATLPNVGV